MKSTLILLLKKKITTYNKQSYYSLIIYNNGFYAVSYYYLQIMKELYIIQIAPFIIGLVLSIIILNRMRLLSTSGMFFRDIDSTKDKDSIVEVAGTAILPILIVSLCISLGLPKWLGYDDMTVASVERSGLRIMQVLAGCALLYIVGLKNDIHGTGMKNKFIVLLTTACMFPISNLWVQDLQGLFGIHDIPAIIGMPLTALMVMYLTEMIALMDDIDGLGAGLVSLIGTIFLGLCIWGGFTLGAIVSSALLGVCIPYTLMKMFSNKWRKTLMGNSGSHIIGYILSYLTLSLIQQGSHSMPIGVVMIVIGTTMVPILDVIRVLRLRIRENRAILTPDRNQMQHQFIRMGVKPSLAPICIAFVIVLYAAINTAWVVNGYDLTILAVIDILLWISMQVVIGYTIRKHETRESREKWIMAYGREAWEANPPIDVIRRKRQNFGTMGLPKEVILGEETDFIPDGMNAFERNTKRLFDMLASGVMLLLTSPLFLLSYILIKLDDGGPAIYAQERLGRFGRPFRIYKFRSMRLDAEKSGPALSHAGGDDDPRLTKIGKFLRAHHLDELPQLWNVFCGDMAFIGYRPERKFFIDQIMEHDPRYAFLYQIRPGVTSYATLYNGYTDTMEKMLRRLNYDLYYLEHRSFWFDIRILWLTFISIVFGKKF